MKDPATFTLAELNQRYMFVRYNTNRAPFISDHKDLYWGFPAEFSLQEARDIYKCSPSMLNKMRTLKQGETRKMSNSARIYNDWGVYRVEPQIELQIQALEAQATMLKQQIDAVAGPLIAQRKMIVEQLKTLKEGRTK